MKDDEKNTLIEHRIARATDTIEEVSFLIKNKKSDYNGFGGADNLLKLLSHKAAMIA